MKKQNTNTNSNNNGKQRVKINGDAKEFAKLTLKKYKKSCSEYDSKKEIKQGFYLYLIELLPATIDFVVKYGHIREDEVQVTKGEIYEKFVSDEYAGFIKMLRKEIKKDNDIDNIKLLPIIIKEILVEADKQNRALLAADPNAKIYKMEDLVEVSKLILKKRLKKMEKAGIDINVAFDVLSIIPTDKCLKTSQNYRIHAMFEALYEHAKTKTINFEEIMNLLVGEEYYLVFIAFALLERKEKFGNLTDEQKTFYLDISTWAFKTLESMSKEQIQNVLKVFVNGRKRDEAQGKDGNRRYALSSLSETDYPKIRKVIDRMIAEDGNNKKYF